MGTDWIFLILPPFCRFDVWFGKNGLYLWLTKFSHSCEKGRQFSKKKKSFLPCKEFLQCSDGNSSHFHTIGKEIRWVFPLKYINPLAILRGIKEGRKPKLNIINSLMRTTFNMMVGRTPYFLEKLSSNLFWNLSLWVNNMPFKCAGHEFSFYNLF